MPKSSSSSGSRKGLKKKPGKPYADFPLYPHATGKWAKTIRGKAHYFGTWADPMGALEEYKAVADALHAGRTPTTDSNIVELKDVCNAFISSKAIDAESGKLSPRSYVDYDRACRALIDAFGRNRNALDLGPLDFEKLYGQLSRKFAISTLGREVTMVKSIFTYAYQSDIIDRPPKYGPKFKGPSKTDRRKAKAKQERENGPKIFSADDIRRMLDAAPIQVKAMIFLAINGGLGNMDISELHHDALDLDGGWLDYPRPKTGIERRCPLWTETVSALREAIANRRQPAADEYRKRVFLTRNGLPWVRYS